MFFFLCVLAVIVLFIGLVKLILWHSNLTVRLANMESDIINSSSDRRVTNANVKQLVAAHNALKKQVATLQKSTKKR